jgi:hypothetical protein
MERGRFSEEYAQFLCDRFYRRYRETCHLKVICTVEGCQQFTTIPAKTPEPEQNIIMDTFKCNLCISDQHSSDDE